MNGTWKHITIGVLLLIAQGALDNYMNLSVYLDIALFMYIILMLPARMGTVPAMIIAFITGLVVDILGNGIPGMTSAALTAAALCRRGAIIAVAPKDFQINDKRSSIESLGIRRFAIYSPILIFIYLLVYILIDNAGFRPAGQCIARLFISLAANTAIMTALFAVCCNDRRK